MKHPKRLVKKNEMYFEFMRVILMFDLPMVTKKDVKIYTNFRKWLISNGFVMMQYSVYSRIFNNRDAAKDFTRLIKRFCPQEGQIRIMIVTEKQYANIEIVVGGKSNQEKTVTVEPFLLL